MSSSVSGSGVIGGQAFFDNDNDGIREIATSFNSDVINDVNVGVLVSLFACDALGDASESLAHVETKTFSNGFYRFSNVARGKYYIVAQPPAGYEFSEVWSHGTASQVPAEQRVYGNNTRELGTNGFINTNEKSTINPETGRTICFEVQEGEKTMSWGFGLFKPSDAPSVQPSITNSPTMLSNTPSSMPSLSSVSYTHPSRQPSSKPTTSSNPPTFSTRSSYVPSWTANYTIMADSPVEGSSIPSLMPSAVGVSNQGVPLSEFDNNTNETLGEISSDTNKIIGITCGILALLVITLAVLFLTRRKNDEDDAEVQVPMEMISKTGNPVISDVRQSSTNLDETSTSSHYARDAMRNSQDEEAHPSRSSSSQITYANRILDKRSTYSDGMKLSQPQLISHILPPASSYCAAEAERKNISKLEEELNSLSTAIQSFPQNSKTWFMLNSQLQRAREELDAVQQDHSMSPHLIHIIAPSGNLGMIVDSDGGSVYVCGLDPLSPVRDQIQVNDIIIAIDDEDTREMSPADVGNLLSRKKMNDKRKISIVRESDVFVG
ncbi:hypothetical protein ACHAXR_003765 [Thalassiosira sp. AJA248-18]